MSEPALKPGDKVLYVADHGSWHERDRSGRPLFRFVHLKDRTAPPNGGPAVKAGDVIDDAEISRQLEAVQRVDSDGTIWLQSGQPVKVAGAKAAWPGVVVEEAVQTPRSVLAVVEGKEQAVIVHDEKRRLSLEVAHPNGVITLHYPLSDTPRPVAHDPSGTEPHSWHRPGED